MKTLHTRIISGLVLLIIGTTSTQAGQPADASSHIDEISRRDLQKHEQQPNLPTSDARFVRRIYLDAIGRIPTTRELAEFQNDSRTDRRARLVDALLDSHGHVSHMYNWLGDMLRVKDKYDRIGTTYTFHTCLKQQLKEKCLWNEVVHEILTAEGRLGENGATA